MRLNEDLLPALVRRLEEDLPSAVAQVNATRTDPHFPIDCPVVYDFVPSVATLVQFPTIGVMEGDITFEDDTAHSATSVTPFGIVVFEQAMDQRELTWKLRRHAQAVSTVVLRDRRLGEAGWGMMLSRIDTGPTLGRDDNPREMMSLIAVQILVRAEQDADE